MYVVFVIKMLYIKLEVFFKFYVGFFMEMVNLVILFCLVYL